MKVEPKDATDEALRPCERGGRVGGLSGDNMFCNRTFVAECFSLMSLLVLPGQLQRQ